MVAPSHTVDDRFLLAGSTLDARVDVEAPVARGGFGVVYRGFHRALGVPVAVKVLQVPEQYSSAIRAEFHRRFVQEAQLVYQLAHPAIVRLLDHGVSRMPTGEHAPWMVLEWLEGNTLAAACRARGEGARWDPSDALELLRPIFEALAMVHARAVAHRDITPANIFLCETPAGRVARLIDFGVARVMEPMEGTASGLTATQSSITAFSKPYGAPEQFGHTRTGPWTDVHALALVLIELVTGKRAYEGSDDTELLTAAMSPVRPTPASKGVDLGAYEPVLAKALALRPSQRYADADAFLRALEGARRSAVVRTSVVSRNRVVAVMAALAVLGGSLAGVLLAQNARGEAASTVPPPPAAVATSPGTNPATPLPVVTPDVPQVVAIPSARDVPPTPPQIRLPRHPSSDRPPPLAKAPVVRPRGAFLDNPYERDR